MKINLAKSHAGHLTYLIPATDTDAAAICRARNGELRANKACTISIFAHKLPSQIDGQPVNKPEAPKAFLVATYWIDETESKWLRKPDPRLLDINLGNLARIEIVPEKVKEFELEIRWS